MWASNTPELTGRKRVTSILSVMRSRFLLFLLAGWTASAALLTMAAVEPARRSLSSEEFIALVERTYAMPPELKAWRLQVTAPRATFDGTVDFERLDPKKREQIPWPFSRLASGELAFSAAGKLSGSDGRGAFDLEILKLGTVEIPHWLIRSFTPAEAIDPASGERLVLIFPLPDGVRGLELVGESVVLIQEQAPTAGHAAPR